MEKHLNTENSHFINDSLGGYTISCLCGIHEKDSMCEVYLRNTGQHKDLTPKEQHLMYNNLKRVVQGGDVCTSCEG